MLNDIESQKHFDIDLLHLIQQRDYEAHKILEESNPAKLIDSSGSALLHFAAQYGNDSIIQHLIHLGCDIDAQDNMGRTALLLALSYHNDMSIKILLEAKAAIHISDFFGRNPFDLIIKMYSRRSDTALMFFQRIKDDCNGNSKAIARKLIKAHCPLYRAMYLDDLDVIRIMIKLGYDVNSSGEDFGMSPLHAAVEHNNLDAVKLLVECGADVMRGDTYGYPALCYMSFEHEHSDKQLEIIKILVSGGVSYEIYHCSTLLKFGDRAIVKAILGSNIDMFAKDKIRSQTVLHYLAENVNVNVIDELDGKSFDVNVIDMYGNSPLHFAASAGISNTVEYLLKRGADPNITDNYYGYTALYNAFVNYNTAAHEKYKRIIEILLKYDADAQVRAMTSNQLMYTVFDIAVSKCCFIWAELVIAHLALHEAQGCEIYEFTIVSIESHPRLKMFLKMCRQRLKKMKMTIVCGYVTLFNFLTASDEQIVMYARNVQLIRKLKIIGEKSHLMSSYGFKLRERLTLAVKNKTTREEASVFVGKLTGQNFSSNSIIMDKILRLMSFEDIEKIAIQWRDEVFTGAFKRTCLKKRSLRQCLHKLNKKKIENFSRKI